MQARFLLGPAGSGKTHRCLADIRAELKRSPDGPPLVLLAPKQATFQLERQLLADPSLAGYARLQILSFERLAQFVLDRFRVRRPGSLSEAGRVMVLRALLRRHQDQLQIFRASARRPGFAQQLSFLLREFQNHQLPSAQLDTLAARADLPPPLRAKLHDLALLLRAYTGWLKAGQLQDAGHLLDAAIETLHAQSAIGNRQLAIGGLWLDGFAEMTPQELRLLAALAPFCERATLAFCLNGQPEGEPSWLSAWSLVAQTFRRCHAQLAALENVEIDFETLANTPGHGRFANNETLRSIEANWSDPSPKSKAQSPKSEICLAECTDASTEATFAAREILRHVRAGGRFRECAVILRSLEPYHAGLARTFRRYGIPVFLDRREGVAHHPLAELTRCAVRAALQDWRHDDWFGALKTGLVPAADDAIDRLENAALAHGWQGKAWRNPLPAPSLEKVRQLIFPPFAQFADALAVNSVAPTGSQFAEAIRRLWRELAVEETLQRWSINEPDQSAIGNRQSAIHSTVFVQMQQWLENLELAFANEALPLAEWLPILEAGLSGLTVGVVPPALDQVLIGAIDRSRNPDLKLAVILGLNEGGFPAPPAPGTLLTDADRAGLENADIYLGPTPRQRLGQERYLGYIACTRPSERLVLTWSAQNAEGEPLNPSPFIAQVKQITGATEESFSGADNWTTAEHLCELETSLRPLDDAKVLPQLGTLAPLAEKWRQVKRTAMAESIVPAMVERLYGRELRTSVSALEEFAACPFKFFTARGLRLRERKEFQFDARDKGSFQHEVLEEFHKRVRAAGRQWRDLSPVEAGDLAATIGRELLPSYEGGKFVADGAAQFTGNYLIERVRRLMTTVVAWMPQYGFDPVMCEGAFDDDKPDALPSWRLEAGTGRVLLLRGRVDRVDLFRRADGTGLAVVMDYKSSVRKLDDTRLYHGLELQLLSYLGVLHNLPAPEKFFGVRSLAPAGVFYVPLNGGADKSSGTRAEVLAAAEDQRRAAYQHSGRFLADELPHFDNRNVPKGDQFKYARNQDGNFSRRGNEALPDEEFAALQQAVEEHLRDFGRRIFAGETATLPYRIGKMTACERCDFRPVCRFDSWTHPYRTLHPPEKDDAA